MPQRASYIFMLAMIAVTATGVLSPHIFGLWLSSAAIVIGIILLLLFFASILFAGRGAHRSVGDVILVAVSGILPLPVHFAVLYRWIGIHLSGSTDLLKDLGSAFYFSVVTWTTLGYGDIVPSVEARPIVIIEATLGYLVMALLIAALVESLKQ